MTARQQRFVPHVRAVIALGANLGDRRATLAAALNELHAADGVRVDACSHLYETAAVTLHGVDDTEPAYLNAVAIVSTTLTARELLDVAHTIENRHGRVRAERWGARTLDLDIIDFDGRVSDDPALTLPHPRAAERSFVLVPWRETDPNAELVGHGSVARLVDDLGETLHPSGPAPTVGEASG